jgi:hypothetical protein
MNPEPGFDLIESLKRLWPEFTGGFVAFWIHNLFHSLWHRSEKIPMLVRKLLRRGGEGK